MYTITQLTQQDNGLTITWQNNQTDSFSWFWLKDHGEDEVSLNPETLQRQVDTFAINSNLKPDSVELLNDAQHGQRVRITWAKPDKGTTDISAKTLAAVNGREKGAALNPDLRHYWCAGSLPNELPSIDYQQVIDDDKALAQWLQLIDQWGFAVVENGQATEAGTVALAERIAPAQQTIFGTYWPLSAEIKEHADSAYTTGFLAPHTDATYYHNAAGLQMFNCLEFDGKGGESILVDGFAIAQAMQKECPEHYALLSQIPVTGRYIEPGVHLEAERPVFRLDRNQQLTQISVNNYDRAPFKLDDDTMSAFYAAYAELNKRTMDEGNWLKIPLRPGMALIFDNWRCLHGRMGYVGKRVFYGCYHDKAIFESRRRVLQALLM